MERVRRHLDLLDDYRGERRAPEPARARRRRWAARVTVTAVLAVPATGVTVGMGSVVLPGVPVPSAPAPADLLPHTKPGRP